MSQKIPYKDLVPMNIYRKFTQQWCIANILLYGTSIQLLVLTNIAGKFPLHWQWTLKFLYCLSLRWNSCKQKVWFNLRHAAILMIAYSAYVLAIGSNWPIISSNYNFYLIRKSFKYENQHAASPKHKGHMCT